MQMEGRKVLSGKQILKLFLTEGLLVINSMKHALIDVQSKYGNPHQKQSQDGLTGD